MRGVVLLWLCVLVCTHAWQIDLEVGVTPANEIHFRLLFGSAVAMDPPTLIPHAAVGVPANALPSDWTFSNETTHCASVAANTSAMTSYSLQDPPHNSLFWNLSVTNNTFPSGARYATEFTLEALFTAPQLLRCGGATAHMSEDGSEVVLYNQLLATVAHVNGQSAVASATWEYGLKIKAHGAVEVFKTNRGIVAHVSSTELKRFAGPYDKNSQATLVDHAYFNGEISLSFTTVVFYDLAGAELKLSNPVVHTTAQGLAWALISPSDPHCIEDQSSGGFMRCVQQWRLASIGARKLDRLVENQFAVNFTVGTRYTSGGADFTRTAWAWEYPLNVSISEMETTSGEVVKPDTTIITTTKVRSSVGAIIGIGVSGVVLLTVLLSVFLYRQTQMRKEQQQRLSQGQSAAATEALSLSRSGNLTSSVIKASSLN